MLWALGLLFETQSFLFLIINFAVWNTGLCGTRLRHTNANLCLERHNNRRPLVFTKCLFNENCYVSSLSGPLMAPVLLQVLQRCWNIWLCKRHVGLNTHHLTHSRAPTDTSQFSLLANREVPAIGLSSFQWQTANVGCQSKNTQQDAWVDSHNLLVWEHEDGLGHQ